MPRRREPRPAPARSGIRGTVQRRRLCGGRDSDPKPTKSEQGRSGGDGARSHRGPVAGRDAPCDRQRAEPTQVTRIEGTTNTSTRACGETAPREPGRTPLASQRRARNRRLARYFFSPTQGPPTVSGCSGNHGGERVGGRVTKRRCRLCPRKRPRCWQASTFEPWKRARVRVPTHSTGHPICPNLSPHPQRPVH